MLEGASRLDGLADEEKALADTVDHWGLPFGDQLTRFRSYFAQDPKTSYAVGVTHDLVKILPNKFWFRGQVFLPGRVRHGGRVTGRCRGAQARVTRFREVFLKCLPAPYPRLGGERWPDPLVECQEVQATTIEPGVCWVDIEIPRTITADRFVCEVEVVRKGADERTTFDVPVRVVRGIELEPKRFPLVAWFGRKSGGVSLSDSQFMGMCKMVLKHHCMPMKVCPWDPKQPEKFDAMFEFLLAHGQKIIEIDRPPGPGARPQAAERFNALYRRLKEKDWLKYAVAYSNADEPDVETFRTKNVPFTQHVRKTYPGLRIYLASELHEGIEQGCDIVLTDLSSSKYDPKRYARRPEPELWHYYCHLPVR
jgi:hypothetical protein